MTPRLTSRSLFVAFASLFAALAASSASASLIDLGTAGPERLRASGVVVFVNSDAPTTEVGESITFALTVDGDTGLLESFAIGGVDSGLSPFALSVQRDSSAGRLALSGSDATFPFVFEFRLDAVETGEAQVMFSSACPGCFIPIPLQSVVGEVRSFEITPVPELAAAWLVAIGACAGLRRLRAARRA